MIAHTLCNDPLEFIVESMGSVLETNVEVQCGSNTSTNNKKLKDVSKELIAHCNRSKHQHTLQCRH